MYKNLSPAAIGIFGRQTELVEIALTHRFKGFEIDITELTRRAQTTNVAQACRYLCSAPVLIAGFELPIRWAGDTAEFEADLAQLPLLLEVATAINADRCFTSIRPTCEQRPFPENFKFHVERLQKLADLLAPTNVKLGLSLVAAPADRADGGFEFIHQVDPLLALLSSVQRDNVGIAFDAWSWTVGGGDVEKLRTLRGDQIISVRLADIPAGVDLTTITHESRVLPGSEGAAGEGTVSEGGQIDSAAIVSVLSELDYDGPVAVSAGPEQFKGQKRESTVTKASAALDALLAPVEGEAPVVAVEK